MMPMFLAVVKNTCQDKGGNMKRACIQALVCLFVFAAVAHTEILEKSSDLSAFAGFLSIDMDETELVVGARYGYNVDKNNALEATVEFMSPEKTKVLIYHLNIRHYISIENQPVLPFFTGGVGAVKYTFDQGVPETARAIEGTSFSVNFGGGLQYFTGEHVAERLDIRDIIVFYGDKVIGSQIIDVGNVQNLEVTAGISYFFI